MSDEDEQTERVEPTPLEASAGPVEPSEPLDSLDRLDAELSAFALGEDQQAAVRAIKAWFSSIDGLTQRCGPRRREPGESGEEYAEHVEGNCPPWAHTHGEAQNVEPFALGGLAGTGKTSVIARLEDELGIRIVFGTPTHKAASVLRDKLTPEQAHRVRTRTSLVSRAVVRYYCNMSGREVRENPHSCGNMDCEHPKEFTPCGQCVNGRCRIREDLTFVPQSQLGFHAELVVLDEASMMSREDIDEVRALGVPVLITGDHGQLPPVRPKTMNPWIERPNVILKTNYRQHESSGIVPLALAARANPRLPLGSYGDETLVVDRRTYKAATDDVLRPERFPPSPDHAIITATNRMRAIINRRFHGEGPPRVGDRVISRQECRNISTVVRHKDHPNASTMDRRWRSPYEIAGGPLTLELRTIRRQTMGTVRDAEIVGLGGTRVALIVELDDLRGEADACVRIPNAALAQFGAEKDLDQNDPRRPMNSRLWDYAYALTAHSAQGSQFDRVVVVRDWSFEEPRWAYTAITRARRKLIFVDWR